MPKLQDTKNFHKELKEELDNIKRDSNILPELFRKEAQFSIKCKEEKDKAEGEMKKMEKGHKLLVNERDDLKNDKQRKERLAQLA